MILVIHQNSFRIVSDCVRDVIVSLAYTLSPYFESVSSFMQMKCLQDCKTLTLKDSYTTELVWRVEQVEALLDMSSPCFLSLDLDCSLCTYFCFSNSAGYRLRYRLAPLGRYLLCIF